MFPFHSSRNGFSLLELLVVMALVATLMGLAIPAFNSFGKANGLTVSGNQAANLASLARQNSLSRNVMTALIIDGDPASPDRSRAFALWELAVAGNAGSREWKPVTEWQILPTQVISALSNFTPSTAAPAEPFPTMIKAGRELASYHYILFLPDGSLMGNQAAEMNFAEGFYPPGSETAVYTGVKRDGAPANYYKITVLPVTGRTKIERP